MIVSEQVIMNWPGDDNNGSYVWFAHSLLTKLQADSAQRNSDVPAGAVIHFVVKQQGIVSYTSPDRTVAASKLKDATCFFQHRELLTDEYHILFDETIAQLQGKFPV
jgi:hypothetical protein